MMRLFRAFILVLVLATPAWPQSSAKVVSIPDTSVLGTLTLVRAANFGRISLSCTNHTVAVRWGDNLTTATRGQRIAIGASAEISTRDAVYMISEGATSTVSCTEETK